MTNQIPQHESCRASVSDAVGFRRKALRLLRFCHSFGIRHSLATCRLKSRKLFNFLTVQPLLFHSPSGVVTSVPAGGLNSKVDRGIGARVWFEYVVTIRSPFGSDMSVRSTRNFSLICRSSF